MKYILITILSLLTFTSFSQSYRYFHFSGRDCGHGNWQDTVFTAAASDQALIDTVLAELNEPFNTRRFIAGPIDYGNGGFNYNAGHSFQWHHIPDQWTLVEVAIEICDGCPYSDLDMNTPYFVDTVGTYCPWGGVPIREIQNPTSIDPENESFFKVYPNPVRERLRIESYFADDFEVKLYSLISSKLILKQAVKNSEWLYLDEVPKGVYLMQIDSEANSIIKKLIVE